MGAMNDLDIQIDEHVRVALRLTMEAGGSVANAGAQIIRRVEYLVGLDGLYRPRHDESFADRMGW